MTVGAEGSGPCDVDDILNQCDDGDMPDYSSNGMDADAGAICTASSTGDSCRLWICPVTEWRTREDCNDGARSSPLACTEIKDEQKTVSTTAKIEGSSSLISEQR